MRLENYRYGGQAVIEVMMRGRYHYAWVRKKTTNLYREEGHTLKKTPFIPTFIREL